MFFKIIVSFTILVLTVVIHSVIAGQVSYSKIKGKASDKVKTNILKDIPDALLAGEPRKRNPDFAISVASVLKKLKEQAGVTLIDVRNSKQHEEFRIPGSLNIPLFAVKTKSFLKSKPLILINEGYVYSQLERECKNLRAAGYQAWILTGGLNCWRYAGGNLDGDLFAQKDLNKIPPRVFFEEKNYDDWIIIDTCDSKKTEARHLFPGSISVQYSGNSKSFISKIKVITSRYRGNSTPYVLIFDDNGRMYENIEKSVTKIGIKNVFYLKGGLEEYKTFLRKQVALQNPGKHSTKNLKKCASCP